MHNSCVLVNETKLKVDLTKYAERHQFNFDEALDEYVSNDQVRWMDKGIHIWLGVFKHMNGRHRHLHPNVKVHHDSIGCEAAS